MALNTQNTDAISFKKLSGKTHTQQNFSVTEESIGSNVSMSYSTVFGNKILKTPVTTSGLTSLYATDGIIEVVKFALELIPDTLIGTNQSQGYRLKLPSDYTSSGKLKLIYSGGTKLYTALGKLQIVPPLYGSVKSDGSTEFDPVLYQTDGSTVIPKFDSINWYLDYYSGILFVQNPPAGYDVSSLRPGFLKAYLYVGQYLDNVLASGTSVSWGSILNKPTTFPATLPIPLTGVTGLQSALNNKLDDSQLGAPNGVTPLNGFGIIPSIYIPSNLKEVFVVSNLTARGNRFVASGDTPSSGQTESFEGLRVFVLNASPEFSGSTEYVDTTGFLAWSAVTDPSQIVLDWNNIIGKPSLVNRVIQGAGLNVSNGGTGFTTMYVDVDGKYIGNLVPSGRLTLIENSVDASRLKYQANNSGSTGQYVTRGTGNTFQMVSLPDFGVDSLNALSGVTNIGTATDPILIAEIDNGDGSITVSGSGLRVNQIGINKLLLGSSTNRINADLIPLNTGTTYTQATDVGTAIEKLYTGYTSNSVVIGNNTSAINSINNKLIIISGNSVTGGTNLGTGVGKIVKNVTGHTINFKSIKQGQFVSVTNNTNDVTIAITGVTGSSVIGPAEDGSYTDGIFTDFTPTTPIGTAVDRFNELFLLVLPQQPAGLTTINGSSSFVTGKLSWGVSRNDISYINVGTNAGNAAVDINGTYSVSGTRLGITRTSVTGILNSSVVGDPSGIPFFNNAFSKGNEGKLLMYRNGTLVSTLILSGTTGTTSNSRMSVSAVQFVKSSTGSPVSVFKYRTGTYTIPTSGMSNGYNYIRIIHSGSTFSTQTNFLEFAYDADTNNISVASTGLTGLVLSGSKTVSGVKFHTGGTVNYQGTISNAYRNVYSVASNAIDFPSKENLGTITNLNITGTGIVARTGSTLQTLPNLNTAVSNPQNTSITILGTLPISSTVILGNVGTTGRLRSGLSISHPFSTKQYTGAVGTMTGFLVYNVTQANTLNSETFTGEVNRLEARDYTALTYANINSGTYAWDSTQSLIGVNTFHNTGMLVFNDELMYPNAAYLTTTYGITTGNFAAVTNTPASNVNYTSASGIRSFYRKYTSANGTTQSTLTFTIDHTGASGDFMTNGGTGGTPSVNNIKVEFMIKRSGGQTHGWANPFASTGNPEGISNTSISQAGSVMTVTCTLSTVPRVATGDIVIVRTLHSSGYTNRIRTISITNI